MSYGAAELRKQNESWGRGRSIISDWEISSNEEISYFAKSTLISTNRSLENEERRLTSGHQISDISAFSGHLKTTQIDAGFCRLAFTDVFPLHENADSGCFHLPGSWMEEIFPSIVRVFTSQTKTLLWKSLEGRSVMGLFRKPAEGAGSCFGFLKMSTWNENQWV